MAYSLEVVRQRLNMWLDAEAAVAKGQSYEIDNQKLVRADLGDIREQIKFWQAQEAKSIRASRGRRAKRIVPRDI